MIFPISDLRISDLRISDLNASKMRYPLPRGSPRRLQIPHHYSAVGASVKGRFVGIKGLSAFSESIKSCVRAVSLFYFDILEVVGYMHMIRQIWNPSNSCLPAAVGHIASVLEKRNPLNIPGWVQLHLLSGNCLQNQYLFCRQFLRKSLHVPNCAQTLLNPWVPNL